MFHKITPDIKSKISSNFKSNIELIINEVKYNVHKNILCDYYEYFSSSFNVEKKNKPNNIELEWIFGKIENDVIEVCINQIYDDYSVSLYENSVFYKFIPMTSNKPQSNQIYDKLDFKFDVSEKSLDDNIRKILELYFVMDYFQIKKNTNLKKECDIHINNYLSTLNLIGSMHHCIKFNRFNFDELIFKNYKMTMNVKKFNLEREIKFERMYSNSEYEELSNYDKYHTIFWINFINKIIFKKLQFTERTYNYCTQKHKDLDVPFNNKLIKQNLYDFLSSKFELRDGQEFIVFTIDHENDKEDPDKFSLEDIHALSYYIQQVNF